uniref:Uncharacterized protein n=1 Tax=CrAss-like virus sp. ctDAq1 TaxID=2826822 RepID=A0A8S5QT58_9CAUD|nr:MAG TPA: hypothetical protein [CrAss-like virus sp. ctDAq1]
MYIRLLEESGKNRTLFFLYTRHQDTIVTSSLLNSFSWPWQCYVQKVPCSTFGYR